jgi:hypothetical protein
MAWMLRKFLKSRMGVKSPMGVRKPSRRASLFPAVYRKARRCLF